MNNEQKISYLVEKIKEVKESRPNFYDTPHGKKFMNFYKNTPNGANNISLNEYVDDLLENNRVKEILLLYRDMAHKDTDGLEYYKELMELDLLGQLNNLNL